MSRPARAMVLAAGLGLRMRPLTLARPKPLLMAGGRSMLDRALDHLERAGVARMVVNIHWLGEQVRAAVAGRPGVVISDETDALLDTGGGVARALPLLGDDPFYVVNADIVWRDGAVPALDRLAEHWDEARMDALLLLAPIDAAFGYAGRGDFLRAADGSLSRRPADATAPFVFAGVEIVHPRLFRGGTGGAFSMNSLFDRAIAAGRLHGLVHDGEWYHLGTPEALARAEPLLAKPPGGDRQ